MKYWLEDGGVRLELVTPTATLTATIPTATGSIKFVPEYYYNTTNLNGAIVQRFKGYRVVISISNIINAMTNEDLILKDVLKIVNEINGRRRPQRGITKLNVIPKYGTTTGRHNHMFEDMVITSDIDIQEPERFLCYQVLNLDFVSRKLIRVIPTQFTQEIPTPTYAIWGSGAINIYTN